MDFKSLISQLDQLNEATEKTKTGLKHTAEPGGYGRKDDEDEDGNKIKDKSAEKKGKGRPKKATSTSGEDKKYDFSAFGVTKGKDVKLPKYDKKKTKKHSIKEYLDQMYEPLNEEGITVKPMPGASQIIGPDGKPMGTADAATANTIKQASEKGTLKLGGEEGMDEGVLDTVKSAVGLGKKPPATTAEKNAAFHAANKGRNMPSSGNASVDYDRFTGRDKVTEKDIGKHNNATTGFDALVRKLTPKYGKEAATKIAGKQAQKIKEADMPPRDALASPLTMEAKKSKPDANKNGIPDYAEDGKGKNDLKKKKDKIDEGMMDNIKGMLVPKLMKLLGPDAEQIANAVKQATGGDLTPSKENAIKVVKALGIDRAANKPEMAEGIAGNWQGKLIQALYTLGLLGAGAAAATMWGTVGGSFMATIGTVLLMFANTFFGDAPGQIGAYGKFGNKGTSAQRGLDDNGMPIRNTNVDESANKKKVKEGMDQKLNAARSEGKAHGLRGHSHCGKNYEDMEEARMYHEGYKEGLDECYGQMPIQGYVGETTPVVNTMASYGAEEGELAEADIEESPFSWAAKNTPKGSKFSLGGKEFVKNDAFAFEALDKQLNALLEDKEVTEGMTVSISKGQQGSPDSVSVSAQDGEADQLLSVIKSAGLGLFGGDDSPGMSHAEPMTVDNGGEPAEIGAGGDAIEVVGDHDGMMQLMKKLSGIGGGEQSHDEHSHDEETCESCGGMMEAGHSCGEGQEMVDEVESEDQMTYQMAEDNPPDSGAAEVDAEDASVSAANAAAAAYNPSQDIDEGGDGGEASDAGNIGVEAGDADEEMQASMNEAEDETGEEAGKEEEKKEMSESSFFNLYKKLAMLSEESTSEKDDKAEKAAKKVAKDIEYDEGHKGKDDDKAEKAGKEVKKDIEYDDKKDKKKIDEWANDAGKNGTDTSFETDIDFMMNVISGGLNKRKATGQTTIPVLASQLGRQVSRNTTSINESTDSSDAVAQWKKLAGLK